MTTSNHRSTQRLIAWLMAVAIFATPLSALAQTKISYHSNKYSPSDDVKVGRQAAAEAEQQLPILRDAEVTNYVEDIGRRLVTAIPPQFQHPEFSYFFKVVDARDINAFALPGGPMYVNRGMIQAARTEGEIAGVMAHELSHVALRHGTAQATKAQKYQYGAIAGAILGSVIGGGLGNVIGQGSQVAIGTYFLKFSREYETEADILGAQIMARAGYDPRDLANMFRTIERQSGGSSGPSFLSDHPSPSDRYARINQEAQYLRVVDPIRDTRDFNRIQARLNGMGRAQSMEEIARNSQRNTQNNSGSGYPQNARINSRVSSPSGRYQTYTEGNLFRINIPTNWRELQSSNSVTFAPNGAFDSQGQFTHGVLAGLAQTQSRNLQQATNEYINSLTQGNQNLRQQSGYQRGSINGRDALSMTLSNVNEVTGRNELINVYTTMLRNGNLFYVVAVAPQNEFRSYQTTFENILRSIQIND